MQYNAQKQTAPLGPWQDSRDGSERLSRTAFELYTPLVLEVPTQHSQDLSWEAEVRRPSPDHRKADSLECLRFCSSIKSLHIHQYIPHCALSSSISTIRGVPIQAIFLLSLRHLKCSQGFPPPNQRWHARNRPLTCNRLRNQEEHRCAGSLRPFSTLFHLLRELDNFSSRFFCQVQRNFWVESVTSHSCCCLVQSRRLVQVPFFQSRQRFLTFLQFLIAPWLVLHVFCISSSHRQCVAHSFLFASQRSNNLASSSSSFRISPHCWLRDFVEKSSTPFCTLNHLVHLSLMHLLHFSFSSFFFTASNNLYHLCIVSSHPV